MATDLSGAFTGGGDIVTCSSFSAEGALMNGRRSDPSDAFSVHNGVILAEGALIHEYGAIPPHKTSAMKN